MPTYSMEQHLNAIVGFFRANLQAYTTVEDLLHSDGLSIGTILSDNIIPGGKWPIPTLTPENPAIEVAVPDQTLSFKSTGGLAADGVLVVAIRAWQQHYGDPDTAIELLYRKSLRLGNAIMNSLAPWTNDAFGNGAVMQQARSSYRVDPTTDQRESFTSSLVTVIQLDDDVAF